MAVIKCKMCGGNLSIALGMTVAECEYCGTKQTIPRQDDDKKLTLFARADRLRRACEFDKAAGVYESIVADFPEEAEAYWGLVLCRYGIEYVDDPATGKKVPTCHRSSFDSVLEDADFDQACENADTIARRVYREEAKTIEGIRRGILEVSSKEAPYDIFLCYKETDGSGDRTEDSVMAQNVYDALTKRGYRVFFSRISLEDKLGSEYEPYIFAALNSAKLMLVFGTRVEYFEAVWVKNEWSRFLATIASGQKKTLIPCYKDLDVRDLPQEFQRLQTQDMGAVGAVQDLLRGVEKILPRQKGDSPLSGGLGSTNVGALIRRGRICLEDKNWKDADAAFEQALDLDPECSEAYLGSLCVELKAASEEQIVPACSASADSTPLDSRSSFIKAVRFASPARKGELDGYRRAVYANLCAAAQAKAEGLNQEIRRLEGDIQVIAVEKLPQNEGELNRANTRVDSAKRLHSSKTSSLNAANREFEELSQPAPKKTYLKALFGFLLPVWLLWRIGEEFPHSGPLAKFYHFMLPLGLVIGVIVLIYIATRRPARKKQVQREAQALEAEVENAYNELKGCLEVQDRLKQALAALRQNQENLISEQSACRKEKERYSKMAAEYQAKAA